MNNEQWIEGGNCEECRRKNYCTKPCRAKKIFDKNAEKEAARKRFENYGLMMEEFSKVNR